MARSFCVLIFSLSLWFNAGCQSHQSNLTYQSVDRLPEHAFTDGVEGPAVDQNQIVYAVNYAQQGTIGRITGRNTAEVFVRLPGDAVGNGIRFNRNGDMLIADYVTHRIWRVDMQSRQITEYAHQPEMNQPNDIAITSDDVLYASDPNWADSSGKLWMIKPNGTVSLIESGMGTTNGIEVCDDDRILYVNESVQRKVWRYRLDRQGIPQDKTLFYQFDDHGLDGMRCDIHGNLYIARYGAGEVVVLAPNGNRINQFKLRGDYPTNLAFGGEDGKDVFVTMQKRGLIESFRAPFAGRAFQLRQSTMRAE